MKIKAVLRKLILLVLTIVGVTFITFWFSVMVPGDPVAALVGERATPEIIEAYRAKFSLDEGLFQRYFSYLSSLLSLDMGVSYSTGRLVADELIEKLPNTVILAASSLCFAIFFGIPLGLLTGFYKDSFFDRIMVLISTALISLPVFWFAMILVYLFAYHLNIFPVAGMSSPLAIVLPAITLGSRSLGYLVRLVRSMTIDIMQKDFILSIKAKGASNLRIIYHVFLNILVPVITFIGLDFGSYMNGSVLTESIFAWDGIGRYAVQGIFRRDYPVILGTVVFGALIFISVNFIIDSIYSLLNPSFKKEDASDF